MGDHLEYPEHGGFTGHVGADEVSFDRVAGRYTNLSEEQNSARTVFSLAQDKALNLFDLRRRYSLLAPLVDTEYGSATFITADRPEQFEVRVSATGLLIRRYE